MFPGVNGDATGEATELSAADSQGAIGNEDLRNLQNQNNTLRASVAQLRKKNAEVSVARQLVYVHRYRYISIYRCIDL